MKRTLIQNAIIVNEGRTVPGSVVRYWLVKKKRLPPVMK